MNSNLLNLALDRLQPSDWAHFERLSSAFLATEFSALRTMANSSGDGGRDAELYSPTETPIVAIQYSVTEYWKVKINATVARIKQKHPDIKIIIYMTNQVVGALGDDLKKEVLKLGYSLDIRDKSWFLERSNSNSTREQAAQEIIDRIALPYLAGLSIIDKPVSPLSTHEARAALLYLGLQWQDDATDKGLTKLSFDALVRAALRNTSPDCRISRQAVFESVCTSLPIADHGMVKQFVDAALTRLAKRYIRHWPTEDEFCLTHEERLRIQSRLADEAIQQSSYNEMIRLQCEVCLKESSIFTEQVSADLQLRVPRVLERFLLRRGECFVASVLSDQLDRLGTEQLTDIIVKDINSVRPPKALTPHCQKIVSTIIRTIFSKQDTCLQPYLRRLSVSYTLFSFLNQTPDVQAATRKLFSHGTIWIDTSVLLPLIAEQLEEDEIDKRLSRLFLTCKEVGIKLHVTTGVIQEINSHMNNAVACSHNGQWQGRVPYLYFQYIQTGKPVSGFSTWLLNFRGAERQDDDLAQYLREEYHIYKKDLGDAYIGIDDDLRFAADRLWTDSHKHRRINAQQYDEATTRLLIKHDVEMYLGVISLRKAEPLPMCWTAKRPC